MKLFTRYNRVNIAAIFLTFVAGSIGFYFVLDYVLTSQLDRALLVEKQEVVDFVKMHDRPPAPLVTRHQWIDIENTNGLPADPIASNTNAFNSIENETEPVRKLVFTVSAGGKNYKISVYQSRTETEDLLQLIILVTIAMMAFMLLFTYLINRKLVRDLWKPFYQTIDAIKEYHLSAKKTLELPGEKIDELHLLNDSLNRMTARIHHDYLALQTFTENASHEMQTPLAIIRSKVETLLHEAGGQEKIVQRLLTIEDATLKLSRLHQSLLLLTKLENRQFELSEPVHMTAILQSKLEERKEFIAARELIVVVHAEEVSLPFHHHLAEILINNLLNNVIRYTPVHGTVGIRLNTDALVIKNYASNGSLNTAKIFQRFYKQEQSTESTGLGLAIVKEICTLAGFTISYEYAFHEHNFAVRFH